MDLDLAAVQALSSPTRVRILKELLREPAAPAELGEALDLQRDQVIMHVETLKNAGLVEEYADDRIQFGYRPTKKAAAIVDGEERKVRFSLAASVISAAFGVFLLAGGALSDLFGGRRMAVQAAARTAEAGGTAPAPEPASLPGPGLFLGFAGFLLVATAFIAFFYGILVRTLGAGRSRR